MNDNVVLNKVATIERCILRIEEEYDNNPSNLENFTRQDAIVLNLQRACEASIDLAMHICAHKKLGIPQTSKEAFAMLAQKNIISNELSVGLKKMVGFRNIAVHDYQGLNIDILQKIIEEHLNEFIDFTQHIIKRGRNGNSI